MHGWSQGKHNILEGKTRELIRLRMSIDMFNAVKLFAFIKQEFYGEAFYSDLDVKSYLLFNFTWDELKRTNQISREFETEFKCYTSGNFNFKMLKTSKVSFKSSSTSTLPYKYFLSLGYRLGSWFMYGLYRDAMATMWNVYGKKLRKEKTLRCEYHFLIQV